MSNNNIKLYEKTKMKLRHQLEEDRKIKLKQLTQPKFNREKYITEISRKTNLMDEELKIVEEKEKERIRETYIRRISYAKKAQKMTDIKISKMKRKELLQNIYDLTKPAFEKVPRIIRKTGKYYDIKLIKPKSLANTQSLQDDNFYSDISTQKADTRNGTRPKMISSSANTHNTLKSRNNNSMNVYNTNNSTS